MEMYILEERLNRIEEMLKFIVDNTIASGLIEELKKDNVTKESKENWNDAVDTLTTDMAGFIRRYLDGYFKDDDEEEEEW